VDHLRPQLAANLENFAKIGLVNVEMKIQNIKIRNRNRTSPPAAAALGGLLLDIILCLYFSRPTKCYLLMIDLVVAFVLFILFSTVFYHPLILS